MLRDWKHDILNTCSYTAVLSLLPVLWQMWSNWYSEMKCWETTTKEHVICCSAAWVCLWDFLCKPFQGAMNSKARPVYFPIMCWVQYCWITSYWVTMAPNSQLQHVGQPWGVDHEKSLLWYYSLVAVTIFFLLGKGLFITLWKCWGRDVANIFFTFNYMGKVTWVWLVTYYRNSSSV